MLPAATTEKNTSRDGIERKKKSRSSSSSRRFSDEQIKSLESVFKRENKLEARKKMEMARELGLQPRQVAIWFQNRRARWKSKQVEQDYTSLKADYDTLSHRFESLKKEKHDLLQQLSSLKGDVDGGSENGELNLADQELMAMGDGNFEQPGGILFDQSCSTPWWDIWSTN